MGSSDGSATMVRDEFPQATLLPDAPNRGYGAAANLGAARARGDLLLILNSDVEFTDPLSLSGLAPLSVNSPSRRSSSAPSWWAPTARRSGRRTASPAPAPSPPCSARRYATEPALNARAFGHIRAEELRAPAEVGWVTGAVLLLRRETFARVGGFDERFFLNSEEVDLCARLWAVGGRSDDGNPR